MRQLALLVLLVASCAVFADTGLRTGNSSSFLQVRELECAADAGLWCIRDAGTSIGKLSCVGATATETGCVTPSAQTYAGTKTLTGDLRLVGHLHSALTACAAGQKGTLQTCTSHSALVYCNGTTNIELVGLGNTVELPPIYVNGLLHANLGYLATWNLPFSYTITGVSGSIAAGAGTTQTLRFTDGVNNCDCSIDCTVGTSSGASPLICAGNCTFAASTQVAPLITADGCTTPTTARGELHPAGYR